MITLYLQSSAGGYYAADDLVLDVTLDKRCGLHLTTQASTVVHHARGSAGARSSARLNVGCGSLLEFCPDPNILMAGSRLTARLDVNLATGARAIVTDAQLCHDPEGEAQPFAHFSNEIVVRRDGDTVLIDHFDLEGAQWMARTGGFACAGTVIVAGAAEDTAQRMCASLVSVYAGLSDLKDRGLVLARILAPDGAALCCALQAAWSAARESLTGQPPRPRRK